MERELNAFSTGMFSVSVDAVDAFTCGDDNYDEDFKNTLAERHLVMLTLLGDQVESDDKSTWKDTQDMDCKFALRDRLAKMRDADEQAKCENTLAIEGHGEKDAHKARLHPWVLQHVALELPLMPIETI